MRLLIASSWGPVPPVNGARQRAHAIVTHLAARHEVHLLTFAEPDDVDRVRAWGAQFASCRIFDGNPHKPQRRLRTRDYFSRLPRSYALTFDERMAVAAREGIAGVDAVLALQIGTALYFSSLTQRPRVFEEAEVAAIEQQRRDAGSAPARLRRALTWQKYSRFTVGLVNDFDMTTVVSGAERDLLCGAGADRARVAVVPNGVDPRAFTVERTRLADTIVYPGSVTFAANHDAVAWFVREAWPRVRARHPHARFVVTGSTAGVDRSPLQVAGVEFTGQVDDVHALVAAAAMVVVPLWTGGGTRLKVLEAFALGTPVVSTPKGVEGLGVVAEGHALVADTAAAFADAIVRVLDHPGEARARAVRARADIADDSAWPAVLTRLDEVLDEASSRWARRRGGVQ